MDLKSPDLQLRRVLQFKRAIDAVSEDYRVAYGTKGEFQMLFLEQLMQWTWSVLPTSGKTGKRARGRPLSASKIASARLSAGRRHEYSTPSEVRT